MNTAISIIPVRDIVAKTSEYLASKSIRTARLDAELLVGAAIGMDRLKLFMNLDRPMDQEELARAREMVRRRASREPIAYILGYREFCSRRFEVNPAVLIPRPETELVVEHAKAELHRRFPDVGTAYRVFEFGVGSGAIAVTLAADLPAAHIVATEISVAAAEVANRNALKYNAGSRVEVHVQSTLDGIAGPFHAIVANPPYIDRAELSEMELDVADFEPHDALFAEDQGLHWYSYLAANASSLLHPCGFFLFEIGYKQAEALKLIAGEHRLKIASVLKDYAGLDRLVLINRN